MASIKDNPAGGRRGTDPALVQAGISAARQHLKDGDPDAAAAALRHIATRDDAAPAQLAEAAKIMGDAGSPVDAVNRYLEAGRGFLAAGDSLQARQSFAAAYEIEGKNMDALFELGRVDVADDKKHDALDKFVEVLRKSNLKHLPALYEAGCLYEQDGQHNQAILAFKRVVERDKTHIAAFEHLGYLHQVRNQLPDAVANYVLGAEAANSQFRYADAKRLAGAALAIDNGNALARRLLGDAEKAMAAGTKPEPKPGPQPAPAAPTPTIEHSSHASAVSQISDVAQITARSQDAAVPPPPPSTLNDLPPDVALLEQQSKAMAQLAQVQNAVAQTYKQRLALGEEIRKAQAELESLQRQQQAVEEDLSGKRDELAKVVGEREAEEAGLAALGDAIVKSKAELAALSALPALIAEVKAKCASTADLVARTSADHAASTAQSSEVRTKAGAAEAILKDLQAKISVARQATESLERQLADLAGATKDAQGIAAAATAQAASGKTALEALGAKQKAVEAANADLVRIAKSVEQKHAEAETAIKRLEALQAQRKTQFDEIVFKLTPLVGLVKGPSPAAPPIAARAPEQISKATAPLTAVAPKAAAPTVSSPTASPTASSPATAQPAAASKAPAGAPAANSVEGLISGGKFAEAAQRAQTEANAKPKPAEYLVEIGTKLQAARRFDEAAKLFAAARDRDQNNAQARYELGAAYVELGRLDEALSVLHTVEADPEYAVLGNVAIGKCLRRKGDVQAAEARFSKALQIEGLPEDHYHHALYQLADLHESKGDPESLGLALWSYEELQSGNPNYGDIAQRIAKLKAQVDEPGARPEPRPNGAVKQ
jgi:lipopolysaccharide biosynthesis regulator YciM